MLENVRVHTAGLKAAMIRGEYINWRVASKEKVGVARVHCALSKRIWHRGLGHFQSVRLMVGS